jgi:FkbM family methyltransferase
LALAETSNGKYWYYESDIIGRTIAHSGSWENHLRPYFDNLVKGNTLIDIGASIGFFTIFPALCGIKVHSFEPSPEVFDLLKRNVEINNVQDNVTLYNVPLYDKEIELWLETILNKYPSLPDGCIDYEHSENSAVLCLIPQEVGTKPCDKYKFITKTLDSYQLDCNLIKIDTQGADLRILHGAVDTINRCHPVILFEYEPSLLAYHGDSLDGFYKLFKELNYTEPKFIGGVDYVTVPNG